MASSRPESLTTILIVDDNQDNIEVLKVRLESWGYRTQTAYNGHDALKSVERIAPDLMLLDVMMPEISGIEVARLIKSNKALPFIPIIMQTALDSTESKVEGLEAGADDYITKPIDFAELKARVRSMLRIKALQEALEEREKELLEVNERLRHMSQTDGLTGLDNRRHLNDRIEEMFAHAKRLKEPFSLVMCDLDKFKSVNDTYGHQAGDEVLKQLAAILREEAREIDRVGRYGGEEFMLLLPGAKLADALTFAERVRKRIEGHTFTFAGGTLTRTASFGVAGWPHDRIVECDDLVRSADDALYVAKETGRNKVVGFDSDEFTAHKAGHDGSAASRPDFGAEENSGLTAAH
ncbi:MAG: diguanylate cyclase [Gemmatimonadetes bacterium]|nr:diguanylate cyclase [Gemmatimonadota bacterium]